MESNPTPKPKVALLITGGFRTFDKSLETIYENIISKNDCICFFLVEGVWGPKIIWDNVNKYPGIKIGWLMSAESYRDKHYNAIVEMTKNSDRDALKREVFERASAQPGNDIDWPNYGPNFIFNTSGSLLQFYQVWRLWQHVTRYERENNMKFTHAVRVRTDLLIGKPLFISDTFAADNPILREMEKNNEFTDAEDESCEYFDSKRLTMDTYPGDYLITLGVDIVWIAKRNVFQQLTNMVFHYGIWDSGAAYAFNAEGCFHQFCKHNNIRHYYLTEKHFPLYTTNIEDKNKYLMIILRK